MSAQANRVLTYLRSNKEITPMDAWQRLGITRLAARVHELRRDGVGIAKKNRTTTNRWGERCTFAVYSLDGV